MNANVTTRLSRWIIFNQVALLLCHFNSVASAERITVLVTKNSAVPDGNGVFSGFGLPVLNDASQVAFQASAVGSNNNTINVICVGKTSPLQLSVVVRETGLAPDGVSKFNGVWGANWADLAFNQSSGLAFVADLYQSPGGSADDVGYFAITNISTGISQVAREGQSNPAWTFGNFSTLTSPALNNRHQIAFPASILGAGITSTNNNGIYRAQTTNLAVTEIIREGASVPDGNGYFQSFLGHCLNDSGEVAFLAVLTGTTNVPHDSAGIYRSDGNNLIEIARKSYNGTFADVSLAKAVPINNDGMVAFCASFYVGFSSYRGVFCSDGSQTTEIARDGDSLFLSGVSTLGFTNKISGIDPHVGLNNAGQVVFLTGLSGYGGTDRLALIRGNGTSNKVLARVGKSVVPGSDAKILSLLPAKFTLNERGQVAFFATLSNNEKSLLVHDDQWGMVEVTRTGREFLGGTITALDFNGTTVSVVVPRQGSSLNNAGELAFRFALMDGRTGIAVWSPPRVALSASINNPADFSLSWTTLPGITNYVQASPQATTGFTNISGPILIEGEAEAWVSFMEIGGATKGPTRFYRIQRDLPSD